MKYDAFGQSYTDSKELCKLLYQNPDLNISPFQLEDPETYNNSVREMFADMPLLTRYTERDLEDLDEFDHELQSFWRFPPEYKDMDIAKWLLDQCNEQHEMQRVGEELLLYQERDLFDLLRYLKFMVDIMRKYNIVWGVGRGSSVASYVLFLIGIHKVDSLYFDLDIAEFLKPTD